VAIDLASLMLATVSSGDPCLHRPAQCCAVQLCELRPAVQPPALIRTTCNCRTNPPRLYARRQPSSTCSIPPLRLPSIAHAPQRMRGLRGDAASERGLCSSAFVLRLAGPRQRVMPPVTADEWIRLFEVPESWSEAGHGAVGTRRGRERVRFLGRLPLPCVAADTLASPGSMAHLLSGRALPISPPGLCMEDQWQLAPCQSAT